MWTAAADSQICNSFEVNDGRGETTVVPTESAPLSPLNEDLCTYQCEA